MARKQPADFPSATSDQLKTAEFLAQVPSGGPVVNTTAAGVVNSGLTNATFPAASSVSSAKVMVRDGSDTKLATMAQVVEAGGAATIAEIDELADSVAEIEGKIPNAASSTNKLVDTNTLNTSMEQVAAKYLSSNTAGDPFATYAAFSAATAFYYAGQLATPTKNDYALVNSDETKGNAVTRYWYTGSSWSFQYVVNNTPFTSAQLAAINSGITADKTAMIKEMTGASSTAAGETGFVPKPEIADRDKFLKGDGTFGDALTDDQKVLVEDLLERGITPIATDNTIKATVEPVSGVDSLVLRVNTDVFPTKTDIPTNVVSSTAITKIVKVTELPSDAADHPTTLYLIVEA